MWRVHLELAHHARHVVPMAVDAQFPEPLPKFFPALEGLLPFLFVEGMSDFGPGTCGHHILQPIFLGGLLAGRDDFHLVAAAQSFAQGHQLVVHLRPNALQPHLGMDAEGEVERGGPNRQGDQFPFGREDIDLLGEEVELEFLDEVQGVGLAPLEDFADLAQPRIDVVPSFGGHGLRPLLGAQRGIRFFRATLRFVAPVGSQPALGHVVHAPAADLDFHPLACWGHHGGVEGLVAIGLGQADPVAQTVRVGLVEVGDHAVGTPNVPFFLCFVGVQNDPNGKHVIDFFEADFFCLHLVPDAVDALGASHDFICHARLVEGLLDGDGEGVDEAGAHGFGLAQTGTDHAVILRLFVLQAEVFQFRFEVVKAQTMCKGSVHEQGLGSDLLLLVRTHVLQGPHVVQSIGQLDEDHADVVAQGQQHFAEVLRLRAGARLKDPAHFCQPIHNRPLFGAKHALHILQRHVRVFDCVVQQGAYNARGAQPHFPRHHTGHGDGVVDVRLPAFAADVFVGIEGHIKGLPDGLAFGAFLRILGGAKQAPVPPEDFFLLSFQVESHAVQSSGNESQVKHLIPSPLDLP